MNAVTTNSRRVAYGAGIAALLLSLYGCARERIYANVESTPESVISAEDAEQIPIQALGGRDRASGNAGRCDGPSGDPTVPGSRVVQCAKDGQYIRVE